MRPRPLLLRPSHSRSRLPLDDAVTSVVRTGEVWARVHRLGPPVGDGDALFVLVHGIGVSSRYLVPLAEHLARHGSVLLVDLPGFAGLPRPPEPASVADHAAVVGQILGAARAPRAVLVGQSMGTQVAVELAASRPDLVAGAVLVGPTVDAAARTVPRQALYFARSVPHEPRRMRLIALRGYAACGVRWFLETLPAMMRYPTEERIAAVRAPLVLVRGEHDRVAPPPWLARLAGRAGGDARVVTVAGAAHSVVLAHADDVALAALDVARRAQLPARPAPAGATR